MICANTVKLWTPIPFSVVCDGFVKVPYLFIKLKRTYPKNLMERRSHPPSPTCLGCGCAGGFQQEHREGTGLGNDPALATFSGETPENLICWKTTSCLPPCCGAARRAGLLHPCTRGWGVSWGHAGGDGATELIRKANPLIFLPIPVPPL